MHVINPGTFLSWAVRHLTLEEADTGCFVLGVSWVLPGVSQHLGESYFEVLLGSRQTEMPADTHPEESFMASYAGKGGDWELRDGDSLCVEVH